MFFNKSREAALSKHILSVSSLLATHVSEGVEAKGGHCIRVFVFLILVHVLQLSPDISRIRFLPMLGILLFIIICQLQPMN